MAGCESMYRGEIGGVRGGEQRDKQEGKACMVICRGASVRHDGMFMGVNILPCATEDGWSTASGSLRVG
jgi:hypothetical protein